MEDEGVPTAALWFWIVLVLIAAASFWCQATVTEERFVPALNVIACEYNIPNDIAGATLMAAGASSPELFSSIVALFITHSALGLGTVSVFGGLRTKQDNNNCSISLLCCFLQIVGRYECPFRLLLENLTSRTVHILSFLRQ